MGMERSLEQLESGVKELLARIKGGESVRPEDSASVEAARRDGLVEQDPKGHMTLTARGRHLVDG